MAKRKSNQSKRRKEEKKIERVGTFDSDIGGKLFVVFCVAVFFLAFYLLTIYITNKNSTSSSSSTGESSEATISYDEILLGRSLSMGDGEYFVIYYDGSDEDISATYASLVSTYRAKEGALPLYYVDMSSGFNRSYMTEEESNKNPASIDEFSIHGPTLIRVLTNHVEEYIEGEEAITNYLS